MTVIVISYHTSGLLSVTTVWGDLYPRENPCIKESFTFPENTSGIPAKDRRMENTSWSRSALNVPYTHIY